MPPVWETRRNKDQKSLVDEAVDKFPADSATRAGSVSWLGPSLTTAASKTGAEEYIVMKDVLQNFPVAANVVVEARCGTFSTAKACLLLQKHWWLLDCNLEADGDSWADERLVRTYA